MKKDLEETKRWFADEIRKSFDRYKPIGGELREFLDFFKKEVDDRIAVNEEWDYEKNVRYYCWRGGHWMGAVFWYSEWCGLEIPKNNYDKDNTLIVH